mgnify:CR=1 FL=1
MLVGFLKKIMSKCKKCQCDCHCGESLHSHHYDGDLCACDNCNCEKGIAQDKTYENEGGLVVDDTNECESCQ